ncbi:hypothetical protein ACHAPE_000553 [Trichoderma viride]
MAVTPTPQPHVLIIPGAWHPASTMASFADALEAAGFAATVVPTRSVGTRDVTLQDDEAQAKALLQPLLDSGKDVIVLGHSYGGFVTTGLIAGLDKRGREAQGLRGGILGVVYLSAFIPIEGETTFEAAGRNDCAFSSADDIEETGLLGSKEEKYHFYNDIPDEVAERLTASLKGHSGAAVMSTPSSIGWKDKAYDGRRAYIRALRDNALTIKYQDELIARSGVEWLVKSVDASHSAFFSRTDEVVGLVAELAVEFAKN